MGDHRHRHHHPAQVAPTTSQPAAPIRQAGGNAAAQERIAARQAPVQAPVQAPAQIGRPGSTGATGSRADQRVASRVAGVYDDATQNAATRSGAYQDLTHNGTGMGMGVAQELAVNGRQIALSSGSRAAEIAGRAGVRTHISSAAQPTRPGMDAAMSGRSVRPTRLANAVNGAPGRVFNGALGIIGVQQGIEQFIQGRDQWQNAENGEQMSEAGLNMAAGATGATSGAIGTLGALGVEAAGTAGVGMGATVGAAGVLPVVGAAAGGAAAGIATAQRGQQYIRESGLLGQNHDGSNRDWSDMAADWGVSADRATARHLGATAGTLAGVTATAAGSVVGAAGAAVTGVAGLATDAVNGVQELGSAAWSRISGR